MANADSSSGSARMAIHVECAKCESRLSFEASAAGRRAKCQTCGAILRVPSLADRQEGGTDPKSATIGAPMTHTPHRVLRTSAQVLTVLVAAAALTLALYQQITGKDFAASLYVAEQRLGWLRDAFGDTEKDIKAYREGMEETRRRSERLAGELKRYAGDLRSTRSELKSTKKELSETESRIQRLYEEAEKQIKGLEIGMRSITEVYHDTPMEDRSKIDFTVVDGVVTLPDRTAGPVKLIETTLRRSGGDIVISCLLNSPQKNLSVGFSRGATSVTASDGTTIAIYTVNVGKTGWRGTGGVMGQDPVELHPGVPVSLQWKLEVPQHHRRFTLIELGLIVEGVAEAMLYKNVAVP